MISLGPFVTTLLCFIFGGILGQPNQMATYFSNYFYEVCVDTIGYTRWGVPMLFYQYVNEANLTAVPKSLQNGYLFDEALKDYRDARLVFSGDVDTWYTAMFALGTMGTVLRVIAFIGLVVNNKEKQV